MTRIHARSGAAKREQRPATRLNLDVASGYVPIKESLISLMREVIDRCSRVRGFAGTAPRTPDELVEKTKTYVLELHARLLETTETYASKEALHGRFAAEIEEMLAKEAQR